MKLSELVACINAYTNNDPAILIEGPDGVPVDIADIDFGVMRLADGTTPTYVLITPAQQDDGDDGDGDQSDDLGPVSLFSTDDGSLHGWECSGCGDRQRATFTTRSGAQASAGAHQCDWKD